MFENFLSLSKTNNFDGETAQLLGGEAARSSLDSGINLTEKVAKVVARENLNPEQIQRVVEEANTIVDLYKKGETFELAKTADVVIILNKKPEEKVLDDYASPPVKIPSSVDYSKMFGINADAVKDEAMEDGVPKAHKLHVKIVKLGAAKDAMDSKYQDLLRKQEDIISDFVKSAEVLFHENRTKLKDVVSLIKVAFPKESISLIDYINDTFRRKELIEKTAAIVPYDLISDDLKNHAIVMNGNDIMLKQVTTLKNNNLETRELKFGIIRLDDEIAKTREEIKSL